MPIQMACRPCSPIPWVVPALGLLLGEMAMHISTQVMGLSAAAPRPALLTRQGAQRSEQAGDR
jgi:hypothetical protein